LLGIPFDSALFQQFTTAIALDEQMRQDDDIPGAKELHNTYYYNLSDNVE